MISAQAAINSDMSTSQKTAPTAPTTPRAKAAKKKVLHVGCGPKRAAKLHPAFRGPQWQEVRLDVNANVAPDILGSMVDLKPWIADGTYDAVWSSHNLEHIDTYEVPTALREFVRILKPSGFALITCPDLMEIALRVVRGELEKPLYTSPVGPITPLDMLFGHIDSVRAGNGYMRHHTGFTEERLGQSLVAAGFHEVRVAKGNQYDLWALAMMPECVPAEMEQLLRRLF